MRCESCSFAGTPVVRIPLYRLKDTHSELHTSYEYVLYKVWVINGLCLNQGYNKTLFNYELWIKTHHCRCAKTSAFLKSDSRSFSVFFCRMGGKGDILLINKSSLLTFLHLPFCFTTSCPNQDAQPSSPALLSKRQQLQASSTSPPKEETTKHLPDSRPPISYNTLCMYFHTAVYIKSTI